jgi:hypothetical protein
MMPGRGPVKIAVQPWFRDHGFDGKAVLPAVEIMLLLAAEVKKNSPERNIRVMEDARFIRFLEIPPEVTSMEVLVDCSRDENDAVHARLLRRVQLKTMARNFEYAGVVFPGTERFTTERAISPAPPDDGATAIQADTVYREKVPFGPAYHTLQETLTVSEQGAWGKLKAPLQPDADLVQEALGSPFPLDGALHAACVLGQQHVDFVPFPVGFRQRVIHRPTRPGDSYITKVELVSRAHDELVFDLGIFDSQGQVCETVTGIRMRKIGRTIKN